MEEYESKAIVINECQELRIEEDSLSICTNAIYRRKLQNSNTTSKDESLCNAIDNALNLLIEADLVL